MWGEMTELMSLLVGDAAEFILWIVVVSLLSLGEEEEWWLLLIVW
jgi:hypothetical protein